MDKKLSSWIREYYQIDPENCSNEEIKKVTEIHCNSKWIASIEGLEKFIHIEMLNISDNQLTAFDFSPFKNLIKIDCSLNPLTRINLLENTILEEICYYGLRGNFIKKIDFSGNPNLKKIIGGQDGIIEIDLCKNEEIEEVIVSLSSDLRDINLSNCRKLKKIKLMGVTIPYVDLTNNNELNHVQINYLNTYQSHKDYYGPGFPRPFIFVNEKFSEDVIYAEDRKYKNFNYVLVITKNGSKEQRVLNHLKNIKSQILEIPNDATRRNIAKFHYEIKELFITA
jgi:hypothetical protein